jgi:hypothetical protein
MQRLRSSIRTIAGILLLLSAPAAAEVGVIRDLAQGNPARGPYELRGIVDDGDPVGSIAWRTYGPARGDHAILNPDGEANGDGRPSSMFNTFSLLPVVAWSKASAGGFDVVVSRFVNDAWTDPLVLAENATVAEPADPVLLMDPTDGTTHLYYWTDTPTPQVMHRQAPADLSSWSTPEPISPAGEIAVRPTATIHQGELHVAYEVHTSQLGGTPRQIVLARDVGGSYSSEVIGTTDLAEPNRPQVHSAAGVVWVEWIDIAGQMAWTRQDSSGSWDPIDSEPFATPEERDYEVPATIKAEALE